jgi:hypothetical protein
MSRGARGQAGEADAGPGSDEGFLEALRPQSLHTPQESIERR